MGKREKKLRSIITENGIGIRKNIDIPKLNKELFSGIPREELLSVYRKLGGVNEECHFGGRWDIVTDEYIIELDEELHFNDYRLTTLNSSLYNSLEKFPLKQYRVYCKKYKNSCLRAGAHLGKWTNPSSERMFGPAQQEGDLTGNGSPRWKQRAFYDFLKDISHMVTNIPVVRLSIYDVIACGGQKYALGYLLENGGTISEEAAVGIMELIKKRL